MKSCSRIIGMPVNPTTLFVYWELDATSKAMASSHFTAPWDELPLHLCVYDVTDCQFNGFNAPPVRRQRISATHNRWYMRDLVPGRSYIVDLAIAVDDEHLFCMRRSHTIALPSTADVAAVPTHAAVSPHANAGAAKGAGDERIVDGIQADGRPYADTFDGYHLVD